MNAAAASAGFPGVRHPLADSFFSFCLLPTLSLHPSQAVALVPDAVLQHAAILPTTHRHWSEYLIQALELGVVSNLDDPALPLAMLPQASLDKFMLSAGAVLAGKHIRRCISRAEVQALQDQLGDSLYQFVCQRAARLHSGLESGVAWPVDDIIEELAALGSALLGLAFQEVAPAIGQRGLLRLPLETKNRMADLPLSSGEALQISLSLLQEIDPKWLSLFPAAH
ncbi:MAG: hypothetical protein H6R18_429 [Proteobacteria bacterium]|nr:hypothetical protein [Pseudomonadota bacterium]